MLYASRGYELLRASLADLSRELNWQVVGAFKPSWNRKLSVLNRLTARLCRDGFHALAFLPSGTIAVAVPGAIATIKANETKFRRTFTIVRGSRPLHMTAVPGGRFFWGEYFDNAARDEVHIYGSADGGMSWDVAYTFPKRAIRHVHNIVHDPWQECLWVLTGDYGDECRILRASYDFTSLEVVLQGKQQARAVAAVPTEDGLYFASDTPLEQNYIYHLGREGTLSRLARVSGSSIYGCRVGSQVFFSTMVEPSDINRDPMVRIYGAQVNHPQRWEPLLSWRKDRWPMKFFQYGNAFLPDGTNRTQYLALTTVAVESDDMVTSIYSVNP
ncbi:MAG TPA: hypothetical protein VF123_03170 [Candidatus Sulfotelmatobacter sp.]